MDAKWLADQLSSTGRLQTELAEYLGLSPPQVNKMVKGKRRILSSEADRIRQFFNTPQHSPPPGVPDAQGMQTEVVDANVAAPLRSTMNRDVPILGTVSGGAGALQMNGDAIDWARRPPRLEGRTDVFGLYVEDLSMVPAHRPGALIFVESARPPSIGDDVIIELRGEKPGDEPRALIKNLVAVSLTEIRLQQYNPAREFAVPRKQVVRMLRVMPLNDLLGV